MKPFSLIVFALIVTLGQTAIQSAHAVIRPDKVFVAENKKNRHYIQDGLITGGDRAIEEVVIKDIRRSMNPGFERWVIDMEGKKKEGEVGISRPSYYQVAVSPEERRIVFTFFGTPKLSFNSQKVIKALKKSPNVESIDLYPKFEDESWTFTVSLKKGRPIEVFELGSPVRVIVDLQTGKTL